MRLAARVDKNQKEIVQFFRDCHASVAVASQLGHGFPDLVIGYKGQCFIVELKDGHDKKLTPDQIEFLKGWNGQYKIIYNLKEAEDWIKSL